MDENKSSTELEFLRRTFATIDPRLKPLQNFNQRITYDLIDIANEDKLVSEFEKSFCMKSYQIMLVNLLFNLSNPL